MKKYTLTIILVAIASLQFSCKKFVEIDPPEDSLIQATIFQNDDLVTSAVTGIYTKMTNNIGNQGLSTVCGVSSDEYNSYNAILTEFYQNQITPVNTSLSIVYSTSYACIYAANAVLEGLTAPNGVSSAAKIQLQGEALFARAFNYFYLVNLFGPVPLQLTTDYRVTQIASRSPETDVYKQIVIDLKTAEGLLTDKYISTEKVRPNLAAVQALLARVYLYTQDWPNAEKYASLVIGKTTLYSLGTLDATFLKNSSEAIWQLYPPANGNTQEGSVFILTATPTVVSLSNNFVSTAFEANDKRRTSWVQTYTNGTGTYYYPYKYKVKSSTTVTEYSMVLRLAEQYLIRAEARAQQVNLSGAIDDIDIIRNRAGLPLIKTTNPGINQQNLLIAIQKERRVELFSEWGHRWLDLKRTGQATAVLSPLKPQWKATSVLYPIPFAEFSRNPNITQNAGY